ncbi:hypothetical protein EDB86DRAFT_3089879 [Lactarius hatsudake]|nr:hypothetical protein EDB86DRAFT_3089879 [Lactarius hatsudake]
MSATIHTTLGDMHMCLFSSGYYDDVIFHRVIPKLMVQMGDPLGDGSGGTSIWDRDFDEFADDLKHESARSAICRAPWYSQTAETSITHIAFVGGIEEVTFLPCVTSTSNVLAIPISPLPGRPTSLRLLSPPVELLSTLIFTHFLLLLFGPPYLLLATALVLPLRYQLTSAQRILRAFRFYLPVMVYNGVLEAFLASVCMPADLRTQSCIIAAASATLI